MGQRHSDAIAIALGAVNPTAIVHALLRASDEIRNSPEFAGTASITCDDAFRLMVHQPAHICRIGELDRSPSQYINAKMAVARAHDADQQRLAEANSRKIAEIVAAARSQA
ncbi:hypothetical protein [Bradyrhizobium sp. Leo121]|uniref:hypothetical protein n=1 Tax=Bradyrhizobium sp. Leo121 TaxID=1571195 RepID=UPI001028A05F|nr:hypothetical protein [Bradyrhizobium sp. Leo121]RZN30504.1 hypothetical protein CWO90_20420 [Bradyrhizobium sp. Leo121]